MLKILSRILDRDIYVINKSPPEQHSNTEIIMRGISHENKPLNEYENASIVIDDILGSSNSRCIDQFFIRGRHNNLNIYYLSQSYFELPKELYVIIVMRIFLVNQTLEEIENIYKDVDGYDMSYCEYKELCRRSWEDDYKYLCID